VRQADGLVRGVYSQQVPGGHPQLIAYSSQGGSFNTVPLHALNIGLPPFPKSLYALQSQQQLQAGANRNEGVYVEDDMVVVGQLPSNKGQFRNSISTIHNTNLTVNLSVPIGT
jgi:hypothetical protein